MTELNFQFLSYSDILSKYPQVKDLGWNESNLGLFLSSYLLLGLPTYRRRKGVIDENSFRSLIDFTSELAHAHMIRSYVRTHYSELEFMTPGEIVEEYPQVMHLLGWDETKLGKFLMAGLLVGKITPSGRSNLITRKSFNLLVDHAVATIQRRAELIQLTNNRIG